MNYKHSCVLDASGYYKTLVLVLLEPESAGSIRENIQYYALATGEQLLDTKLPTGYVRARWNGTTWEEGATPEEIERWEQEHPQPPLPPPQPDPAETISALQQQVADLQAQMAALTGGEA
jgi:hypothetical protein